MHIFSQTPSLFLFALSFPFVLLSACSDLESMNMTDTDPNTGSKNFGQSAQTIYRCQTTTIGPDGAEWLYETDEIMNLMDSIYLSVNKANTSYGEVKLSKTETDTFSDGNLTVQLIQQGKTKSISVNHQSTSLFAPAENGECTSFESDRYADYEIQEGGVDRFQIEMDTECLEVCSFAVNTNLPVHSIVYEADGWMLAESKDSDQDFATSYTFNTWGQRTLKATGYDRFGNLLATDSVPFQVSSSSPQAQFPLDVKYFYQYRNAIYKESSCQNTSIAMVLSFLGVNLTPDTINYEFGKDLAQTVPGLKRVFNTLAARHGVQSISSYNEGTLSQLKSALDQGKPAIVHGFFTHYGHVVVVTGYDENGYYVNDPAGTWSKRFKGGYPYAYTESTQGKNIYYPKAAFEAAVASYDGYTLGTLYMHILE